MSLPEKKKKKKMWGEAKASRIGEAWDWIPAELLLE